MSLLRTTDYYLVSAVFMLSAARGTLLSALLEGNYTPWVELGIDDVGILDACSQQIRNHEPSFRQMNGAHLAAYPELFGGGCDPPCERVFRKLATFLKHLHEAANGN